MFFSIARHTQAQKDNVLANHPQSWSLAKENHLSSFVLARTPGIRRHHPEKYGKIIQKTHCDWIQEPEISG